MGYTGIPLIIWPFSSNDKYTYMPGYGKCKITLSYASKWHGSVKFKLENDNSLYIHKNLIPYTAITMTTDIPLKYVVRDKHGYTPKPPIYRKKEGYVETIHTKISWDGTIDSCSLKYLEKNGFTIAFLGMALWYCLFNFNSQEFDLAPLRKESLIMLKASTIKNSKQTLDMFFPDVLVPIIYEYLF